MHKWIVDIPATTDARLSQWNTKAFGSDLHYQIRTK
jgi:hypothetical protein